MKICVFGLGEAGSQIAADIASTGREVSGFDPAPVPTPQGIERHDEPGTAARGADLVLAVTAACDSETALVQALDEISDGCPYADLATAAPKLKRGLGDQAAESGIVFADVALMATVPGKGIRTPALVSGPGSVRVATELGALGMPIEIVDGPSGAAASHKLLRSIVMKGLAANLIESMRAAEALGISAAVWQNLVDQMRHVDEEMMVRLIEGTGVHHQRRVDEIEAARQLLIEVGVDPITTSGTLESLRAIPGERLPNVPPQ